MKKQKVIIMGDYHYAPNAAEAKKMLQQFRDAFPEMKQIMIHGDSYSNMMVEVDPNETYMWWTQKTGEQIRIDKMDTGHLKNTIAMLKRNGRHKMKRTAPVFRNMQEEYFKRLGPAGEVLFAKKK